MAGTADTGLKSVLPNLVLRKFFTVEIRRECLKQQREGKQARALLERRLPNCKGGGQAAPLQKEGGVNVIVFSQDPCEEFLCHHFYTLSVEG